MRVSRRRRGWRPDRARVRGRSARLDSGRASASAGMTGAGAAWRRHRSGRVRRDAVGVGVAVGSAAAAGSGASSAVSPTRPSATVSRCGRGSRRPDRVDGPLLDHAVDRRAGGRRGRPSDGPYPGRPMVRCSRSASTGRPVDPATSTTSMHRTTGLRVRCATTGARFARAVALTTPTAARRMQPPRSRAAGFAAQRPEPLREDRR